MKSFHINNSLHCSRVGFVSHHILYVAYVYVHYAGRHTYRIYYINALCYSLILMLSFPIFLCTRGIQVVASLPGDRDWEGTHSLISPFHSCSKTWYSQGYITSATKIALIYKNNQKRAACSKGWTDHGTDKCDINLALWTSGMIVRV